MECMQNYVKLFGIEMYLNRVAFEVFGKPIYWYGIIIAIGFLLGVLLVLHYSKRVDIKSNDIYDFILWVTPISLIGARLYYCIYEWEYYKDNLFEIFYIWHGGIAIYGAIIAAVIVALVFCKIKKIPFFNFADVAVLGLITGQIIGRWGNFMNVEAYGYETALPWGMTIVNDQLQKITVHPTFLYESLWNLAVLALLIFLFTRKRKFPGIVFWSYVSLYGLGRFWIEGLRTDSLMLGNIRISQMVALFSFLAGSAMILYHLRQLKKEKTET